MSRTIPRPKVSSSTARLLARRAAIDADIEQKKGERTELDNQLRALAKQAQEAREAAIGKIAYAAGLAEADDDLLRIEFIMLAKRLCGVETVLQLVGDDGKPLGRSVDDPEDDR